MSEMLSVSVQGLKELERKLVSLGPKLGRGALRSALVSGGAVIKKQARAAAPSKTGRLRSAMYIKRMDKNNPFKERIIFGVRHGKKMQKRDMDAFYWSFLEFGHKDKAGKPIAALSFVRNAFESRKMQAMDRIRNVLQKKIAKLAQESA